MVDAELEVEDEEAVVAVEVEVEVEVLLAVVAVVVVVSTDVVEVADDDEDEEDVVGDEVDDGVWVDEDSLLADAEVVGPEVPELDAVADGEKACDVEADEAPVPLPVSVLCEAPPCAPVPPVACRTRSMRWS